MMPRNPARVPARVKVVKPAKLPGDVWENFCPATLGQMTGRSYFSWAAQELNKPKAGKRLTADERKLLRRHMAHEVKRIEKLLLSRGYTRDNAQSSAKRTVAKAYGCSIRNVGLALSDFGAEADRELDIYIAKLPGLIEGYRALRASNRFRKL